MIKESLGSKNVIRKQYIFNPKPLNAEQFQLNLTQTLNPNYQLSF